ncbi:MAG: GNAT family N-acetyltransferase [Eubacteriales bacterium]|nr:GNAT family N-acetyltransferase [Eubacteriales bacterium]
MDYVIVAYGDEEAIGCAALREYSKESIEVKRGLVQEDCKGKNVGEKLIGLAEILDDGEVNAYIHNLLVCPTYQNQGAHMVEMIKQKYRNYLYIVLICEKKDTVPFYARNGFSTATDATPLQIRTL